MKGRLDDDDNTVIVNDEPVELRVGLALRYRGLIMTFTEEDLWEISYPETPEDVITFANSVANAKDEINDVVAKEGSDDPENYELT